MAEYRLSSVAKEDLIRIHQFGVKKFGITQADKYFYSFFDYFEIIAQRPFSVLLAINAIANAGLRVR